MNKSQSEILTEAAIEMIDTVADAVNDPKSITKTYTYTNKKGVKKTVKRKYEVKSTDAKNPEIKQKIIDVITKNKENVNISAPAAPAQGKLYIKFALGKDFLLPQVKEILKKSPAGN